MNDGVIDLMWSINPCDEEEDPNWGVGWGYNGSETKKETDSERYWREMDERKQQRRDWEDRGEPVGF